MSFFIKSYPLARPALFALDPETAHELTLNSLQKAYNCQFSRQLLQQQPSLPSTLCGLPLKNPVGLAAGMDKNGAYIDALGNLGFGFIEAGTVTPLSQDGNPKPRMFRLVRSQALINRLGFNNDGLQTFIANVQKSRYREAGGVLGLNIGKNAATPIAGAINDYLLGLEGVYPHADYVTINISSPNTENLRQLQNDSELANLLGHLQEARKRLSDEHSKRVPLLVKIAPDLSREQIDAIADCLPKFEIDGVIATNTTIDRQAVANHHHAHQSGGLSGAPLHEMTLPIIEQLRKRLGSSFAIIGVGGIMRGQHAAEKIAAGANAVQLYTGLVYQGPSLVADCVSAMASSQKAAQAS